MLVEGFFLPCDNSSAISNPIPPAPIKTTFFPILSMFFIASIYEITIFSSEPGISRDLAFTPVETITSS